MFKLGLGSKKTIKSFSWVTSCEMEAENENFKNVIIIPRKIRENPHWKFDDRFIVFVFEIPIRAHLNKTACIINTTFNLKWLGLFFSSVTNVMLASALSFV